MGQQQKCFCPVSGEVEGDSLCVLGRGSAKVKKIKLWVCSFSVHQTFQCKTFWQIACCSFSKAAMSWKAAHPLWGGSFATTLPSPEFPPNKMVRLVVSRAVTGQQPQMQKQERLRFGFCNIYLLMSNVKGRVLRRSSSLRVPSGWPSTAQTL